MIKLIFSDSFNPEVGICANLINDKQGFTKQASTVFDVDYSELKPDKNHVGIHLVALGDFEHYNANKNADGWPKLACINYHHTFVSDGHVYRGHKNDDPEKAIGITKASAYNNPMGRIELFIHADVDKAAPELTKMEKNGTVSFSMAAKLPYDSCAICHTKRKSLTDPKQCDHIKNHFGEMFEDGKVACVLNDHPKFFDISFVDRPADRIAWDLYKVASENKVISSVELANHYGITDPDDLIILDSNSLNKLDLCKKLSEYENIHNGLDKKAILSTSERYLKELRKAGKLSFTDKDIDYLRNFNKDAVFYKLAENGIILNADNFFKYAFGLDYGALKENKDKILSHINNCLYNDIIKNGEEKRICNNKYFDIDIFSKFSYINGIELNTFLKKKAFDNSLVKSSIDRRIIDNTIAGVNARELLTVDDNDKVVNANIKAAAEMYAAYKLSAIKGVLDLGYDKIDKETLLAITAVNDRIK